VSRDVRLLLEDMVESCDRIGRYTLGVSVEAFARDEKTIDAVVRNLEIIGEATKRVPQSLREQFSDVPWRKMAGLGDVVAHHYFGIDLRLVWDIVERDVPFARLKLAAILATLPAGDETPT
jgi:uncharacterized protein with HEPN domain